jgi:hypothetical protein
MIRLDSTTIFDVGRNTRKGSESGPLGEIVNMGASHVRKFHTILNRLNRASAYQAFPSTFSSSVKMPTPSNGPRTERDSWSPRTSSIRESCTLTDFRIPQWSIWPSITARVEFLSAKLFFEEVCTRKVLIWSKICRQAFCEVYHERRENSSHRELVRRLRFGG